MKHFFAVDLFKGFLEDKIRIKNFSNLFKRILRCPRPGINTYFIDIELSVVFHTVCERDGKQETHTKYAHNASNAQNGFERGSWRLCLPMFGC